MGGKADREPIRARQILFPVGVGLALALAVLLAQGGVPAPGTETFSRTLCDALTVPGVLLTGAGLLALFSRWNAFGGISFPVQKALSQIRSPEKREAMPRTYYDYVTARQQKAGKRRNVTLAVGLCFLAAAGIALAVYLARYSG